MTTIGYIGRTDAEGSWVRLEDFKALAARLAEAERLLARIAESGVPYLDVRDFLRAADSASAELCEHGLRRDSNCFACYLRDKEQAKLPPSWRR